MARKRNENIKVTLTKEEKEIVKAKAEKMGMNMSEIIRQVMLLGSFTNVNTKGLDNLSYEINKIGVNINQIAKRLNSNGNAYTDEILKMQNDIKKIKECINGIYKKLEVS